ncbi:MAG: alkaline phosphatase family protein [Gemmataceae bacterium]
MPSALSQIDHIVVVMMENRSFDNLLGFLYASENNQPPLNLPTQPSPTYAGLLPQNQSDQFWNPSNRGYFTNGDAPQKVFVSSPTGGQVPFTVPDPDPNEAFLNFNFQIFGTTEPTNLQSPTMLGFYVDYLDAKNSSPAVANQIMQCFDPTQLPVLSALAKQFAVCDAWFGSAPAQTWPNRGFVHTGTSRGQVTNGDVFAYATETIYEVLGKKGISWAVFNDSSLPSLTRLQYPRLFSLSESHFRSFETFQSQATAGTLPSYSFVEPSFVYSPNDQHPPHDVSHGENFLFDIWQAISTSPKWNQTLLVITYDEHGGCYDHVPPPWGATCPDSASNPGQQGFRFDRFGVRVPTVVVSPLIEPGTVFRSPTAVPHDHTSILATLRDWKQIPAVDMLSSKRILAAPTLEHLLTRTTPRTDLPIIPQPHHEMVMMSASEEHNEPLNELQKSILLAAESHRLSKPLNVPELMDLFQRVNTKGAMRQYFNQWEGKP